jgi:hypothetical protein
MQNHQTTEMTLAMMNQPEVTEVTRRMKFIPVELGIDLEDGTEVDFWENTTPTETHRVRLAPVDFNVEGRDAIVAFCERVAEMTRKGASPTNAIAQVARTL